MSPCACFFAGDPARVTRARGDLAVERNGQLEMNERPAGPHEMNVGFVQSRRFIGQQAGANFDARFAQMSKATTGNLRIWIFNGRDDAFDSRFDERIGARWCAAVMRVRFQRNVRGAAARSRSPACSSAIVSACFT